MSRIALAELQEALRKHEEDGFLVRVHPKTGETFNLEAALGALLSVLPRESFDNDALQETLKKMPGGPYTEAFNTEHITDLVNLKLVSRHYGLPRPHNQGSYGVNNPYNLTTLAKNAQYEVTSETQHAPPYLY